MSAMRFFVPICFCLLSASAFASAHAEDEAVAVKPEQIKETPLGPLAPGDAELDGLFAKLKTERGQESARAIADQIRETLTLSGSATVDMLMGHATKAVSEKRYGAALDFLDQVTLLSPDYAEGWNRRATVHYLMGNYGKAMADTAHVLALEPRHLGALSGLAGILEDSGREREALKAWEAYLSYYPADRDAQKEALELINKLTGQKT
jgi:tetratricopeptide (TPR) repeat protein